MDNNRKKVVITSVITLVLLVGTLATSFAYFVAQSGTGAETQTSVLTHTTDTLTFTTTGNIGIHATLDNFNTASGNLSGEATGKASLLANNSTNTATMAYNVYVEVANNDFVYTTTDSKPELVLTVTKPDGTPVTSISGLQYVTVGDVSGFDVTTYQGLIKIAEDYEITANGTTATDQEWKIKLSFINLTTDQVDNSGKRFDGKIIIQSEKYLTNAMKTLALAKKIEKNCNVDFNTRATTNETADGLCAMADDYGTSYYYRGAVDDNWVQFAGFYWRIIRINGDGSVRMIYQGSTAPTSEESVVYTGTDNIGTSAFNTSYNDNAYVGYMYGTPGSSTYEATHANTNNSTIKTVIDAWYKTNIADKGYGTNVADVVYCNDRQVANNANAYYSGYTSLGYGPKETIYRSLERLTSAGWNPPTNAQPTLKCTQKNDAFTVSDTSKGNGKLTYPVGLITADEVSIAGGVYNPITNFNYYLKSNNWYWAASAAYYDGSNAYVFYVYSRGFLSNYAVFYTNGGVRPVISLTADYFGGLKGSGTYDNPFTE